MDALITIELLSVLCNMAFLILFIRELRWSWLFGIAGSILGAYVVYRSGYYSEAILYVFYAIMGGVGFVHWSRRSKEDFHIQRMPVIRALTLLFGGLGATLALGYAMDQLNADKVYYDAFSTVFGIIATILEIYKYYIAWFCWIALNGYSIWLYQLKELNLLSFQMVAYTALSVYGLVAWSKKLARDKASV